MNVTLRRAKALQNAILGVMDRLHVVTQVELNQFQALQTQLQNAYALAITTDERLDQLTTALFSIRKLVGEANASSGIDTLMNRSAYLTRRIAQLSTLADAPEMIDQDILAGQMNRLKNEESSSYRSSSMSTVRSSVLTAQQLSEYRSQVATLRRQKQQIDDEILSLNTSTKIALSDETVATLTAEEII
jgi:hypothetical protein